MFKRFRSKMLMLALAMSVFGWALPAYASAERMLLVLDGIKGESIDARYKDAIEITSLSFGASYTPGSSAGSGGAGGKASFSDLSLTKLADTASLPLLQKLVAGGSIASGKLYLFAGSNTTPYLTIQLKNILVTSDSMSAASGSDRMNESVTFKPAEMVLEYVPQTPKGDMGPKQTLDIDLERGSVK